jgi:hypothetical protein
VVESRRGTVFIAPVDAVPDGTTVDPKTAIFWSSWQDDGVLEDAEIAGADSAVAWGRARSDRVFIRLGHTEDTYYSAGAEHVEYPEWPGEKGV